MVVFEGVGDTIPYLYAGANSHGGNSKSKIYRTPYYNTDSTKWELVIDFNIRDTNVTQVTYFYEWKNKLYFGGNGDSLLYESTDGKNFVANVGVANDYRGSDLLIACLVDFNGYLYAGTNNQNPSHGGQLYRTSDGVKWYNLTSLLPNHDPAVDEELHDIDTANGYLWVTPYTDTLHSTTGIPIWRSKDNNVSAFVQSNTNGFSNFNIDGENPTVYGFKGRQYFGGPNYVEGGQIWRTETLTNTHLVEEQNHNCNHSVQLKLSSIESRVLLSSNCDIATHIEVFDLTGKKLKSLVYNDRIEFSSNDLLAGIYIYRVMNQAEYLNTGKFLIK